MLIDAGWAAPGDVTRMSGKVDVPAVVRYAADKNVKVWIWLHYNDAARQMDAAFPLYEKWGVAGVKIDFMSRDDQDMIAWYYRTAELAARYHLMVDFHGATKPTGLERTFPNVLGYEAVLGMEQSKAGARDNPDSHVTLPFTRMLAGPMDYTPGGFDNVTPDQFVPRGQHPMVVGTRAHQLAMYVVYFAPFQMVSDHPAAYDNQPGFDFIKSVPAAWDQTRALAGDPGQFVILARRQGDDWYLGAMTNSTPRDLSIPLDFLPEGNYTADTYADAPDSGQAPKHLTTASRPVDRSTTLHLLLAPAGGFAARIHPATAPSAH
jgi:alpha-glucosidase